MTTSSFTVYGAPYTVDQGYTLQGMIGGEVVQCLDRAVPGFVQCF
jgi:hypothetical protein